ncbi:MAG: hypothetical protein JWR24_4066, partial [Actinoallomurus sp.]|nr:hypothetical protein [Actinoallomurus sp.]
MGRHDRCPGLRSAPRTTTWPESAAQGWSARAAAWRAVRLSHRVLSWRAVCRLLIGAGLAVAFWAIGGLTQAYADQPPRPARLPLVLPATAHAATAHAATVAGPAMRAASPATGPSATSRETGLSATRPEVPSVRAVGPRAPKATHLTATGLSRPVQAAVTHLLPVQAGSVSSVATPAAPAPARALLTTVTHP